MDVMTKTRKDERNQKNQKNQRNQIDQIDQKDQKDQKDKPSRDSWVKVNPEKPAYQRLHLCKYLAELPELPSEDVPDTQAE
jgi:hypothetical protein